MLKWLCNCLIFLKSRNGRLVLLKTIHAHSFSVRSLGRILSSCSAKEIINWNSRCVAHSDVGGRLDLLSQIQVSCPARMVVMVHVLYNQLFLWLIRLFLDRNDLFCQCGLPLLLYCLLEDVFLNGVEGIFIGHIHASVPLCIRCLYLDLNSRFILRTFLYESLRLFWDAF